MFGILLTALINAHHDSNFKTHSYSIEHNKPSEVGTKIDLNLLFSGKEYKNIHEELTGWLDNTNKNEAGKETFKLYVQVTIETTFNAES